MEPLDKTVCKNYEKENQNCSLQNQKAIYVFWGGINKNQTEKKMMLIVAWMWDLQCNALMLCNLHAACYSKGKTLDLSKMSFSKIGEVFDI